MKNNETLIEIRDLHYRPQGATEDILKGVNLTIRRGDFVLLLGPSGCGKSTLMRCLNGLIPHLDEGIMSGQVEVEGKDTQRHKIHEFAAMVGIVFQNPDDQILSLRVVDEVAWGVENQGLPHDEIVRRVDKYMEIIGIADLKYRLTFAISGGQKQKVSIASNLAMLQDVLILDDPTTDLDPVCKSEVIQTLAQLHRESGKTLIVIEHDLNDLIELANRIVVMDQGRIVFEGATGKVLAENYDDLLALGVNMPQHVEIAHATYREGERPASYPTEKEAVFTRLEDVFAGRMLPAVGPRRDGPTTDDVVISVKDMSFSYSPGVPVLRNISFDVLKGEFVGIVGANGSGKSTLVNNLIGLLHPEEGVVIVDGQDTSEIDISDLAKRIGYVFQNPDHQLFANTVDDEVGFSLKVHGVPPEEAAERIQQTLEIVGLADCRDRHPFSLSRGQRQKLAVATALVHQPRIILLDEPTTGQDRRSLAGLLDMMVRLNQQGNTTIMITHDMDIVAAYASRVIVMADGQIVMDGTPEDIFYNEYEALSALQLRPPTVISYCRRLKGEGSPSHMTVEGLVEDIEEA